MEPATDADAYKVSVGRTETSEVVVQGVIVEQASAVVHDVA